MIDDNNVDIQKKKPDYLWLKLTLLYILGLFVFIMGPVIALLVGGLCVRKHLQYRFLMIISTVFLIIHCFLLFAICIPNFNKARFKAKEAELKNITHTIQLALEQYWVDNCNYPENPNLLEPEGYLDLGAMRNPFTSKPMEITAYDPNDHYASIGYIPIVINSITEGYYIITFSTPEKPGKDIDNDGIPDHVILALQSGYDCYRKCYGVISNARAEDAVSPVERDFKNHTYKEIAFEDIKWMWR